jgi:hypothetical protein
LAAETFEAAADARVHAARAGLDDDPADQAGVDRASGLDRAAGGALNLFDDRPGLVVVELEGGRQLDRELPLLDRGQALELGGNLVDLASAALVDQQPEQVSDERVTLPEDGVDRGCLCTPVELRVAEDLLKLGYLLRRLDEVGELLADRGQAAFLLGGFEERPRVGAVDDAQFSRPSSAEKSSSPIASSIRRLWSSRSSTLPVTLVVAISVREATSARIITSAR